jgi:uncharacterized protein YndB with AHSA1/START domain
MIEATGREIVVERLLSAPPSAVFRAWTTPEIVKWWGPNGFTTTILEMDVRPGGVWRYVMHGPDGRNYPNRVIYLEVDPPSRLVFKHTPEADDEPVHHTSIVTFDRVDAQTRVTMRGIFDSAEALEHVVKTYGAAEGAEQTMDRLVAFVAAAAAPSTPNRPTR